jgi:hypothetical protein
MLSKRGVFVVYLNLLFITALITLVVLRTGWDPVQKRDFPDYVDVGNITCSDDSSACGDNGDCTPPSVTDPDHPSWHDHVCICHEGWVHYDGVCDYERKKQLNAFMASFFGGGVGADWFYLYAGSNGGYIAAGIFKLLTLGGFSFWWLVDWIRVLTFSFPDSKGVDPLAMM